MPTNQTRAREAHEQRDRARLTAADRAWMMAVAERELAQGKISVEEYRYIRDRCRVSLVDWLNDLVRRLKSAVRRTGESGSLPRRPTTPRSA